MNERTNERGSLLVALFGPFKTIGIISDQILLVGKATMSRGPQRRQRRKHFWWKVVGVLCIVQVVSQMTFVFFFRLNDSWTTRWWWWWSVTSTGVSTSTITDDRPCRVAITNSEPFHFETLESVGTLLPLRFLQAAAMVTTPELQQTTRTTATSRRRRRRSCRTWIFDLHLPQRPTPRFDPWVKYFHKHVLQRGTSQHGYNNRTWGRLILYPKKSTWPTIPQYIARPDMHYDVLIEASCYCQTEKGLKRLVNDPRQICIFHQDCPTAKQSWANRSVWLSPHHRPQYYLPAALPRVGSGGRSNDDEPYNNHSSYAQRRDLTPLQLCVTGNSRRRQWSLLEHYLQHEHHAVTSSPPFEIRIYSDGSLPTPLQVYADRVHMLNIDDYWEFHDSIATHCHALVFLVTRQANVNYFRQTGGLQKLTGSMPLVVAYRLPYMVHEELYNLYRDDLPLRDTHAAYDTDHDTRQMTIPFATHTDDVANFTSALSTLLLRLQDYYYGDQVV